MRLRFPFLLASIAVGAFAAACSSSPSGEQGGGPIVSGSTDAGVCSETGGDAGSGDHWSDLYRDILGPTGTASCTFGGTCHGDSSQAGAQQSGYVCGSTQASCYAGITAPGAGLVLGGSDDPTTTGLYQVLRKCSGGGSMPQSPTTVYLTNADMARIAAWLSAGSPDD